ncbi:MAG: extracellular solute-binding protein [Clostridiales bacterium]|nr:extracellular solute-binding protein [Clostridiales bacterium]
MQNIKTRISLLLALLLAASAVSSCGSKENPSDSNDTTPNGTTPSSDTEDSRYVSDDLPDINLDGYEFNILVREEVNYEFDAEQTGDLMDDIIYKRNQDLSERFNCKINYINQPGLWASKSEFQGLITNSVMANDGEYDIVTGQSNIISPLAAQSMFMDVANSKYIDLDKIYWKSGYTDNVKMGDSLYTLCGDYALTALTMSNVIYFNKSILDDLQIEYPYQLVKDGKWTLDAFTKLATDVTRDINGDGIIDTEDLHGFAGYNNSINPFTYSCGISYTKRGADGKMEIDFPSERDIDIYDKVQAFCHSEAFIDTTYFGGQVEDFMIPEFMNGKYLMMGITLSYVEQLRDMDVDFGILPYPQYDENQNFFRTSVLRRYTIAAVPVTAKNHEYSELLLEALSAYGYNYIVPTYYEIALQGKYIRDDDSKDMLDIISTSSWFDFTDAYYSDFEGVSDYLAGYAFGSSTGVPSFFERYRSKFQTNIDKLYEAYGIE